MLHVVLYLALLFAACGYALIAGAAPERIGATIVAGGVLASEFAVRSFALRFQSVELNLLVVDALAYLAFAALALAANRYWTLWIAILQGTTVIFHLAVLFSPNHVPPAYQTAVVILSYPVTALPAIGAWRHRRRVKTRAADPSWARSLPLWLTPTPRRRPTG